MPAGMRFRQRVGVLAVLTVVFLGVVTLFRHSSPALVTFVVREAFIQKAPDGMSRQAVRGRFDTLLETVPPAQKLKKMLDLSNYLEKVQKLTSAEMDQLLAGNGNTAGIGR
jgi:type II secretory pathway component PulF